MNSEPSFRIMDMNTKTYSLHFNHQLFWEVEFSDGTCKVLYREGTLTVDGEKTQIDTNSINYDNIVLAIQDVESKINKKLLCKFSFFNSKPVAAAQKIEQLSNPSQINQKRSLAQNELFEKEKEDNLHKKIHTNSTTSSIIKNQEKPKSRREEVKIEEEDYFSGKGEHSPLQEFHNPKVANFVQEERKGAYLEKIEMRKTLFYKIQILKRTLQIEQGELDNYQRQPEKSLKAYTDKEEAREKMESLIKEKEREGYKNMKKKFVYDANSSTQKSSIKPQEEKRKSSTKLDLQETENFSCSSNKKSLLRSRDLPQNNKETFEELYQPGSFISFKPVDWPESKDPTGFYLREKLGGVTCVWNGKARFVSLHKYEYIVPEKFFEKFPSERLIGIMYLGAGLSYHVGMNMRSGSFEDWKGMVFVVYDILDTDLSFKKRMEKLEELFKGLTSPYIRLCKYTVCEDKKNFEEEFAGLKEKQGEGLFLNDPEEFSLSGVDSGFYLHKNYINEEATVIGYVKENGVIKSLEVSSSKGDNKFLIHKGVKSVPQANLPKIGSTVIYKTMGEKSKNCPKMPIFVKEKIS